MVGSFGRSEPTITHAGTDTNSLNAALLNEFFILWRTVHSCSGIDVCAVHTPSAGSPLDPGYGVMESMLARRVRRARYFGVGPRRTPTL